MAESLKVLMMGGPRSGKTSVLAGLVDSMINGEVKQFLSVKDVTEGDAVKQKLAQKTVNLKQTLLSAVGKTILVDDSKTAAYQHYTIEFAIPGTEDKLNIIFTDANGEFFESGRGEYESEISKMLKDYDVFIIAIDTPSLMEAINPENSLMNEPLCKAINNINDITNFIPYLDDKEGADAKMVIFVPLKCEKWAHEGKLDLVSNRVQQVYATPISTLKSKKNVEIDILPIQTVGNIVFKEHLKSYVCLSQGADSPKRCSLLENNAIVRFANGEEREFNKSSDKIKFDPNAPIKEGSPILRPNSWFEVINTEYAPHNCDLLAFYTLQFILSKFLFLKEVEQKKKEEKQKEHSYIYLAIIAIVAYFSWPIALICYLASKALDYFGSISYEELHKVLNAIKEKNLIKTDEEGVYQVKKTLLSI